MKRLKLNILIFLNKRRNHNDEADYQHFKEKANDYKEFMKNDN